VAAPGARLASTPPASAVSVQRAQADEPQEKDAMAVLVAPPIHYVVVGAANAEPGEAFEVVAQRGGQTFLVLPSQSTACPPELEESDLDGDGLTDVLITQSVCGNCCPPSHWFVAGTAGANFEAQELGRGSAELETWRERSSLVLQTDNEGWNLDRPELVTQRFVFERGRAVVVERKRAVEVPALADLRADQFANAKLDEERSLSFDLDGDNRVDRLVGKLWTRWGRILWVVRFADGGVSEGGDLACKRLGILPEKTMGHRDLVCDFDIRIRWNGAAYEAEPGP
jgi:hypothetical protein